MSAQTMRRLVKLAYAKQENLNAQKNGTISLSPKGKKKHVQRGKTMTNVRVQDTASTEEKVAHRLSVTMNQQKTGQSLHIRSFSLPKEKTPQISEEHIEQTQIKTVDDDNNNNTNNNNSLDIKNHSSHPTITITPAEIVENVSQINNLPSSTMNNINNINNNNNNNKQLDVKYKHISTTSDTHTHTINSINSEFSETVYTENTEYTKDDESTQYGYGKLKPHNNNNHNTTLMSIGSASSMTVSTFVSDSSHDRKSPNTMHVLPPALETVNEPNTMKYVDEDFNDNNNNKHKVQQSVVQHMTAPQINLEEEDEEEEEYDENSDKFLTTTKTRQSIDLLQEEIIGSNNNVSIWSCLMCGCCTSNNNNNNNKETKLEENKVKEKEKEKEKEQEDDEICLQLDMDDWKTFKSGTSRIRRPTAYTTVTNNEDSTINSDDVRMFDDPFGKGASGRVFKALYLPLCQIMALKVTSRLDNDNVKQLLGEYKQQQEFLPDCDELMRIHGWYRNLSTNEIAVALEYMDMGSIYDSIFNIRNKGNGHKPILNEEEIKTGHKQIYIDKLSYDQLRFIARQSLLGLHALHSNKPSLIHRDIKPQNILLSSFGVVKVADFGLLIELPSNGVCSDSKGTSKYFSPERIQGSFDCLSDIWSLGITLIEIYKQELISSEDLDWFKIVEDGIDIDDFLPATTPTEFLDFLKQCLQHQSENRPCAKQLLGHQFITRKWGHPLTNDNENNKLRNNINIKFSKEEGNQKLLDKILGWLEEWILSDEENNGKLFLEGDSEYLKQCVFNLSKYSGLPPKYIDRYIADLYREYTQFD